MLRRPPTRIELKAEDKQEYEEARKAHIRKLQADLARGTTETLVANSFQFNPDGATKEERLGIDPQPQKPAPNASDDAA